MANNVVDWLLPALESFTMSILYTGVAFINVLYMWGSVNLAQKTFQSSMIGIQRDLYILLLIQNIIRIIQNGVNCIENILQLEKGSESPLLIISQINYILDSIGFASLFGVYSTLAFFWCLQFFLFKNQKSFDAKQQQIRWSKSEAHFKEHQQEEEEQPTLETEITQVESNNELEVMDSRTKTIIWSFNIACIGSICFITILFIAIVLSFSWTTANIEFLILRLLLRSFVTWFIIILVSVFGLRLFYIFRKEFGANLRLVALVTIFCVGIFAILWLINLFIVIFHESFYHLKHRWAFHMISSLLELSTSICLLLAFRPSMIYICGKQIHLISLDKLLIRFCCLVCCCRRPKETDIDLYTENTSYGNAASEHAVPTAAEEDTTTIQLYQNQSVMLSPSQPKKKHQEEEEEEEQFMFYQQSSADNEVFSNVPSRKSHKGDSSEDEEEHLQSPYRSQYNNF